MSVQRLFGTEGRRYTVCNEMERIGYEVTVTYFMVIISKFEHRS